MSPGRSGLAAAAAADDGDPPPEQPQQQEPQRQQQQGQQQQQQQQQQEGPRTEAEQCRYQQQMMHAAPGARNYGFSDEFMMHTFKVEACKQQDKHPRGSCPFTHPGDVAQRRPPSSYQALLCPEVRAKKVCPRADECLCSHSAFEFWLHPDRYRTSMCEKGERCTRPVCFFAHNAEELRPLPAGLRPAQAQAPDDPGKRASRVGSGSSSGSSGTMQQQQHMPAGRMALPAYGGYATGGMALSPSALGAPGMQAYLHHMQQQQQQPGLMLHPPAMHGIMQQQGAASPAMLAAAMGAYAGGGYPPAMLGTPGLEGLTASAYNAASIAASYMPSSPALSSGGVQLTPDGSSNWGSYTPPSMGGPSPHARSVPLPLGAFSSSSSEMHFGPEDLQRLQQLAVTTGAMGGAGMASSPQQQQRYAPPGGRMGGPAAMQQQQQYLHHHHQQQQPGIPQLHMHAMPGAAYMPAGEAGGWARPAPAGMQQQHRQQQQFAAPMPYAMQQADGGLLASPSGSAGPLPGVLAAYGSGAPAAAAVLSPQAAWAAGLQGGAQGGGGLPAAPGLGGGPLAPATADW